MTLRGTRGSSALPRPLCPPCCHLHVEAEYPGGLGVDDQRELGRPHDRQVGRLRTLEGAAGIHAENTRVSASYLPQVR
jgi:hypothetical protein